MLRELKSWEQAIFVLVLKLYYAFHLSVIKYTILFWNEIPTGVKYCELSTGGETIPWP